MVDTVGNTFSALAHATRRDILSRLLAGEASVSDLAAPYDMTLPAVSQHLRILERAGLIERHVEGRVHRCRLRHEGIQPALGWIEQHRQFWQTQLGALEDFLGDHPELTHDAPSQGDEEST